MIMTCRSLEEDLASLEKLKMREIPTKAGKLGLRLLEDLTALAAGGSVCAIFRLNYLLVVSRISAAGKPVDLLDMYL